MSATQSITRPFLTAEWRNLIMINWEVSPVLLEPYLPRGTELDLYNGKAYVSVVGFLFQQTRILGVKIPYHVNFEELNLRFYVKRMVGEEVRRGVVFIQELVPRWWIAFVARTLYNENYFACAMSHKVVSNKKAVALEYGWRINGKESLISFRSPGEFTEMPAGSEQEFIAEHYWGYCRQRDGATLEYSVAHPRWQCAEVNDLAMHVDFAAQYGDACGAALYETPASTFFFNGSPVSVGFGARF